MSLECSHAAYPLQIAHKSPGKWINSSVHPPTNQAATEKVFPRSLGHGSSREASRISCPHVKKQVSSLFSEVQTVEALQSMLSALPIHSQPQKSNGQISPSRVAPRHPVKSLCSPSTLTHASLELTGVTQPHAAFRHLQVCHSATMCAAPCLPVPSERTLRLHDSW